MTETKKGTPCPQCGTNMVLQYSRDDPRILAGRHDQKLRVPMRCCRCCINVLVSVDPKALLDDDSELEQE